MQVLAVGTKPALSILLPSMYVWLTQQLALHSRKAELAQRSQEMAQPPYQGFHFNQLYPSPVKQVPLARWAKAGAILEPIFQFSS